MSAGTERERAIARAEARLQRIAADSPNTPIVFSAYVRGANDFTFGRRGEITADRVIQAGGLLAFVTAALRGTARNHQGTDSVYVTPSDVEDIGVMTFAEWA